MSVSLTLASNPLANSAEGSGSEPKPKAMDRHRQHLFLLTIHGDAFEKIKKDFPEGLFVSGYQSFLSHVFSLEDLAQNKRDYELSELCASFLHTQKDSEAKKKTRNEHMKLFARRFEGIFLKTVPKEKQGLELVQKEAGGVVASYSSVLNRADSVYENSKTTLHATLNNIESFPVVLIDIVESYAFSYIECFISYKRIESLFSSIDLEASKAFKEKKDVSQSQLQQTKVSTLKFRIEKTTNRLCLMRFAHDLEGGATRSVEVDASDAFQQCMEGFYLHHPLSD